MCQKISPAPEIPPDSPIQDIFRILANDTTRNRRITEDVLAAVGVTPEEDEDFDFEKALRDIHVELEDLDAEAVQLAALIKKISRSW
ncbi:hypothetical protein [Nitrosomonas sp. ANs5]|uniref:hypothetical protein n=1 Tax=Nitrosomonas sp. ANs5 TaxID=3423941 RepID=UPI003D34F97E